jgi:hypothetical protein
VTGLRTEKLLELCDKNIYMRGDSTECGDYNTAARRATFWKITVRNCVSARVSLKDEIAP